MRFRNLLLFFALFLPACSSLETCGPAVRVFGPEQVEPTEAYAGDPAKLKFDHSAFDALLKKHVNEEGWVDYESLKQDEDTLLQYTQALEKTSFKDFSRDGKLALLINAYNAFTLQLMLEFWPLASIKDIKEEFRWKDVRWQIGGLPTLSLDQIENDYLRARFKEPRIHFAINCASKSCPPLRNEAFAEEKIEAQLENQTRRTLNDPRWAQVKDQTLYLSPIFLWFESDFKQAGSSVLSFVSRYSINARNLQRLGREVPIKYLEYDWSVNFKKGL